MAEATMAAATMAEGTIEKQRAPSALDRVPGRCINHSFFLRIHLPAMSLRIFTRFCNQAVTFFDVMMMMMMRRIMTAPSRVTKKTGVVVENKSLPTV
jgi:hypothetical protein